MRYLLRLFVAFATLVTGCLCYSYFAYYGGKFEAHLDLMTNSYTLRVYGTHDFDDVRYYEILRHEYGVDVVPVAGCIVSYELRGKTRGYNDVMETAIEQRFGNGTVERLWQRARREAKSKPATE